MRFLCTLTQIAPATWLAWHHSREVGQVEARGPTREEAVAKIEGEIRYRLELCPCSGETWQHLDIQIVESE